MDSPLFLRIGLDTKYSQVRPQLSRHVTSILTQKVPVKTMEIWGHTKDFKIPYFNITISHE